jgi:hypothetical protein
MDDTVGRETARRTIDDIVDDYQRARRDGDHRGMRRHQREETCVVLLTTLGFLAADMASFVHGMSLKGGMLMRGELGSPRTSADIDFSTGHQRRPDADAIGADLRRAGRAFDLRLDESPETTSGGFVIDFTFASRCDGGRAKLEVSVREDLVCQSGTRRSCPSVSPSPRSRHPRSTSPRDWPKSSERCANDRSLATSTTPGST